jgi:hypothetical protein
VHVPYPRGCGSAGVNTLSHYINSPQILQTPTPPITFAPRLYIQTLAFYLLFELSSSALSIIRRNLHSKMDQITSDDHCDLQQDQEQFGAAGGSASLSPVRLTPVDSPFGHADPFLSMVELYTDIHMITIGPAATPSRLIIAGAGNTDRSFHTHPWIRSIRRPL